MVKSGARTYLKTHKLSGKQLQFRLLDEATALMERAKQGRTGRTAKTLVKEGPFRMLVVAMRKGTRMGKHSVDGQTAIQVLRGKIALQTASGVSEYSASGVAVLGDGVEHDVIARADCAFLITLSWHEDGSS